MPLARPFHFAVWPATAVVILDQFSKWLLLHSLQPLAVIPVLDGFFNIVHVRNRGMAFGLLGRPDAHAWRTLLLVGASLAAIIVVVWWLTRLNRSEKWMALGLSLVLGGALGNLIDRLAYGEVIDFLDFYAGSYHWPAFNVADAAITTGTILIGLTFLRGSRRNLPPQA